MNMLLDLYSGTPNEKGVDNQAEALIEKLVQVVKKVVIVAIKNHVKIIL
jgi:hypothetical protein